MLRVGIEKGRAPIRVTRRCVVAGLVAVAGCGPAPGADPRETVRALYDPYVAKHNPPDLLNAAPWTPELRALLARAKARERETGDAIIDFDPIVDGSDWDISNVEVDVVRPPASGRAAVRARFVNLGDPVEVIYTMKQEGGGWRVDDIRGAHESLREVLAAARITPETRD